MPWDRKKYRKKHRERINKREAEYRKNNPEIIKKINQRYRESHKEEIKKLIQNKILFKDKRITFSENPRTNICSNCGKKYPDDMKHQTVLHHPHYESDDPLEDTIELCKS